ncbi:glycosyltransferase family 2 protein [Rathayibacter soli]|uniref:glycosyltransferase family 2 protein n=1 Tax=Rathayibacter soli TaxID=3144168 RepID=UPI0027E414AC|nr:glycosyltransferase family 2 protein [Glaciibacter superstes]
MAQVSDEGTLPGVSYVMPVLNEVAHVRDAVDSLLAQDYAGPFEVALALGPSIDGTTELVTELSQADSRIRILDNEIGSTPSGLNIAINASRYPIVIRVDAHSVLPPEYARIAVETILRTDADNVGGVMDAQGTTPFERAVAHAYGSALGLGGTKLHRGGEEGPAETVYLGVFKRSSLFDAGLFNEEIKRGQDWELNRRLRSSGGTVWFTPKLSVVYRPRASMSSLARQFLSTGLWRGELARRFPEANGIRYFAPPIMVLGVVVGLILGIIGIVQANVGATPWLLIGFVAPAFYLLLVVAAALAASPALGVRATLWYLLVLPCIHFCWGIGFVLGIFALTPNISAHTGR